MGSVIEERLIPQLGKSVLLHDSHFLLLFNLPKKRA